MTGKWQRRFPSTNLGLQLRQTIYYRPVSILPTFLKILEKIVYKQLMAHLERHSLLFEQEFVFRPNRSTKLQLLLTSLITSERRPTVVRQQEQFSLTYQRRLMSVFTTINHSVLLRKLSRYDVYDMKPQWFIVYLLLGKQIVQFLKHSGVSSFSHLLL